MMKRTWLALVVIGLVGMGCNLVSLAPEATPTPQAAAADSVATAVQATLQALMPAPPTSTPAAPAEVTAPVQTTAPSAEPAAAQPAPATQAPVPAQQQPGGLTVAYTVAGNIYLWQPGLSPRQLTEHGKALEVSLSPDAAWIAYTKYMDDSHAEIWALRRDGSQDKPLVILDDLKAADPAQWLYPNQMEWLPGSHTLYYNTATRMDGPGSGPANDLRAADADSGQKATLLQPGQGGKFALSPDGQKLLLVQYDRFLTANRDGSSVREIFTYPYVYTYSEWQYLPDPVWMANSAAFRVIIPPQDPLAHPDEPSYIWEIPADGSAARQISHFQAVPAFFARPLLSPDGSRVAYQTQDKQDDPTTKLHLATVDLSSDLVLQSGQFAVQSWSPDSLRVVIWSNSRMEMRVAGLSGDFAAWPVGIQPWDLRWIDGKRFMVLSGSRDKPELYLGTTEGQFVRIATASAPNLAYDFVK